MEQETTTQVIRHNVIVSAETKKRLKVLAAQRGVSMGEMIRVMLDEWLVSADKGGE